MPKPPNHFIFCVHAHQPVGNFENVFLDAYERCYRPFFEVLDAHPGFPIVCHFSGSLIDWLEARKPEFIRKLRAMTDRGQIEWMGGAYYEPIYGAIPRADLSGQIRWMREKIGSLWGQTPRGAWLTERVWDPELVKPLGEAGVEYTVLDDFHLEKAGIRPPVTGYYRVRSGFKSLDVFASLKSLRYLMPFRTAEEAAEYLCSAPAESGDVRVFADDCEKFGFWPGTGAWVYGQKWLDKFFSLLENDPRISLQTFEKFRKLEKPKRRVRIPHASYGEMMEWSGGRFYNFFDRYPESRYMKERMWELSRRLNRITAVNGSSAVLAEARRALYRAQCNCSYWHGVFGGLYLHHLRSSVFENLIEAERGLRKISAAHASPAEPPIRKMPLESGERWVADQPKLRSFWNPAYGAALEELDWLPLSVNLACNLQRRREPYHRLVSKGAADRASAAEGKSVLSIHGLLGQKEANLDTRLFYDSFRRLSFIDRFFACDVTQEQFEGSLYTEIGDFAGSRYRLAARPVERCARLAFERKGFLRLEGATKPLLLKKKVSPLGDALLEVGYELKNPGRSPLDFVFGVEFNFSIGVSADARALCLRDIREAALEDVWRKVRIRLSSAEPVNLLSAAVETVSGSEAGLERTYQGLGILLQKAVSLEPDAAKAFVFKLEVV